MEAFSTTLSPIRPTGAGIPDLDVVPFFTNSDAHSVHPTKLGREFNRLDVAGATPKAAFDAVRQGRITLNAGFFPEEGKYNRTACTRCYRQYTLEEAAAARVNLSGRRRCDQERIL